MHLIKDVHWKRLKKGLQCLKGKPTKMAHLEETTSRDMEIVENC